MSQEGAPLVRNRLVNAGEPYVGQVELPYEEVIRVVLLLGYYEHSWAEHQIVDALNWWRALPETLPESEGWAFTLRDLEPAWINEKSNGDFTAVYVSTDTDGRMLYEVQSSHGNDEFVARCPDASTLSATLADLARQDSTA